MKDVSEVHIY